jgi:HD-like signal output (HDOD) protein
MMHDRRVNTSSPQAPEDPEQKLPETGEELAALLGIEPPQFPAQDEAERGEVDLLARLVVDYCQATKPDPTSFPALASRVMELSRNPNVDVNKMANLIGQDVAISAKILRIANSPMYRRNSGAVETVRAAVLLLGLNEVGKIAVAVASRSLFEPDIKAEYQFSAKRWNLLFLHSLASAFGAAGLSLDHRIGVSDQAFLGGMFHDVGKTIALRAVGPLLIKNKIGKVSEHAIDMVLERVHVRIGAELHASWKLPDLLTYICKGHHDPTFPAGPEYAEVHLVRVASGLAALALNAVSDARILKQVLHSAAALKLNRFEMRAFATKLRESIERLSATFEISV